MVMITSASRTASATVPAPRPPAATSRSTAAPAAVEADHGVTGGDQVAGHRRAHDAQAEEGDGAHDRSPPLRRSQAEAIAAVLRGRVVLERRRSRRSRRLRSRQVAVQVECAAARLTATGMVGDLHVGDPRGVARRCAASRSSPLSARWNRSQQQPDVADRQPVQDRDHVVGGAERIRLRSADRLHQHRRRRWPPRPRRPGSGSRWPVRPAAPAVASSTRLPYSALCARTPSAVPMPTVTSMLSRNSADRAGMDSTPQSGPARSPAKKLRPIRCTPASRTGRDEGVDVSGRAAPAGRARATRTRSRRSRRPGPRRPLAAAAPR